MFTWEEGGVKKCIHTWAHLKHETRLLIANVQLPFQRNHSIFFKRPAQLTSYWEQTLSRWGAWALAAGCEAGTFRPPAAPASSSLHLCPSLRQTWNFNFSSKHPQSVPYNVNSKGRITVVTPMQTSQIHSKKSKNLLKITKFQFWQAIINFGRQSLQLFFIILHLNSSVYFES